VFNRSYNETQFGSTIGLIGVNDQTKVDVFSAGVQGLLPVGTLYTIYGSSTGTRDVFNGISKNYQTFGGFQVTQRCSGDSVSAANLEAGAHPEGQPLDLGPDYKLSAINTVTG